MTYSVKEIFYTLQGEGANAGRVAVFCRFTGCNLWSGRIQDRPKAICRFCDTDFVGTDGSGGGEFATAEALAEAVAQRWTQGAGRRFVVCTGGEPLLQVDAKLIRALHGLDFEVAVETNGTQLPPPGLDWICVSPKSRAQHQWKLKQGNELKVVFPQEGLEPRDLETLEFQHFFLQPMDGQQKDENTRLAIDYCLQHPRWRLSLQTHKLLGIP